MLEAHRLVYHSTLGWRVIKNKKFARGARTQSRTSLPAFEVLDRAKFSLHFEPSLDALSLRSGGISSVKILSTWWWAWARGNEHRNPDKGSLEDDLARGLLQGDLAHKKQRPPRTLQKDYA